MILSKKTNALPRHHDLNVDQKEQTQIKFKQDKTHIHKIIFYSVQDRKGRHRIGLMSHQQDGFRFHYQSTPREEIYRIQIPHHGNDSKIRNGK